MTFSPQLEARFEKLLKSYPPGRQRSALIPMLLYAQDEIGSCTDELIDEVARQVMGENGMTIEYRVGTMIELPRAALMAQHIAAHADFFSFGTNDLTQTTFGLSRDDSARFLPNYVERKIMPEDPFQVLDRDGVGQLVRLGTERGRSVKPDLKVGICGEHGGDPSSIAFCNEIGLDYVSCSPFRVPVARLAAAQASLAAKAEAVLSRP